MSIWGFNTSTANELKGNNFFLLPLTITQKIFKLV